MERLRLGDGSSWPEPDPEDGAGWKLRYNPAAMTREEQLQAASIIDAYNYLFEPTMTVKAMQDKIAMLRRAYRLKGTD